MNEKLDLVRSREKLTQLLDICRRRGRILVLMQNNPDPDAIACAASVRDLVHRLLKKRAVIGYGGVCGRAENRAMLRELHIDARRVVPSDLNRYRTLCLVDTQPRAGNNALYTSHPADIVIDHHIPPRKSVWQAEMTDIRPHYGATSTILFEYYVVAGLKPRADLATAMFYGVESDTQVLGRDTCPADIEVFQSLIGSVDKRKLARIRRAPVPPEYFKTLRNSLTNAVVAGSTVITLIRGCENPDMFAEAAELMLRLQGMRASVAYGPLGDVIYVSVRAADARGNAAARMKRVMSRIGTGGGHRSMAGGQVAATGDLEKRLALVHARIVKHFARDHECRPLLASDEATVREANLSG